MGGGPEPPAVQRLREQLGRVFRITVPDGRTLEGKFVSATQQGDIILDQTLESYETRNGPVTRNRGLVHIPPTAWTAIERREDD